MTAPNTPPRIPQTAVQGLPRETVRFLQDLVNRVQKLEANGTVPRDAVSPMPAIAGGAVPNITGALDSVTLTPQTVAVPDAAALPITSTAFYGDWTTTDFVLPAGWDVITDPETLNVSIDGAVQATDQYTVAAGVLTMAEPPPYAPPSGDPNVFVKWIPDAVAVATLANANKAAINHNAGVTAQIKTVLNSVVAAWIGLVKSYNSLLASLRSGGSIGK